MASVDQPLKKRKLYDPLLEPPIAAQNPSFAAPPPPPLSQEEILRRRRNREEIRSLYDCYRRIRFCVSQKDARLMPDFEQAYLSLITASRGCTSVQRIVAELIPRYASFCPTALEAAAKVSINMYNWNMAMIMRGEDVDGVAYQTAKACIFGLVDICCTASYEAPTSSVIRGICSEVFQNVLTFFTSTFEGKDIYQIGSNEIQKLLQPMEFFTDMKEEPEDDIGPPLCKLFKFRALSLLRIFFSFPKNLLAGCFELLVNSGTDVVHRKGGQYFLNQLISHLNADEVTYLLNKTSDHSPQCTNSVEGDTDCNGSKNEKHVSDEDKNVVDKSLLLFNYCFIGMAIEREPSLRGWMLSRYKKLCESASTEEISEISSFLEKLFGSLAELVKEADYEESDEDNFDPSKYINHPYSVYKPSIKHDDNFDASSVDRSMGMHTASMGGAHCKDNYAAEKDVNQNVKSYEPLLPCKVDIKSINKSLTREGERSISINNLEIRDLATSCPGKSSSKDLTSNQIFPVVTGKQSEFNNDNVDVGSHVTKEKIWGLNTEHGLAGRISSSSSASKIFPSPRQHLTSWDHVSSNQVIWFSDGDPAAMDVFSASKILWLGSLGHDASEMVVRLQFEDFGPLEQFIFIPAKNFALIEYRNIMDAVKAREFMHGSSPWGSSLCIRFVDRGLGTRGVANGVAIGDSYHVYVGKVTTQWAKDEILHELMTMGLRNPRAVTDLASESALLVEFATVEEAASAMACIRRHRKETGCHACPDRSSILRTCSKDKFVSSHELLVRQVDASVSDEELISAFSRYGELTRWKFNRTGCSCLIEFRSYEAADLAKSRLHGAKFGPTSIIVEFGADDPATMTSHVVFSPPAPTVNDSSIDSSRTRKTSTSGCFPSHEDPYSRGVESQSSNPYPTPFNNKPESGIHELVSPRVKVEKLGTKSHIGHAFQSNWTTTGSSDMAEAGSRKVNEFGSGMPLDHSFAGFSTSHAAEQVWQYKQPESEPQIMSQGRPPCPPIPSHGVSVIPPPIQASSFVCPVYFNPSSPWDSSIPNPSLSLNQIPRSIIPPDNRHFNACPAVPFIPSSVTPLSQLSGGSMQHFDQIATPPGLQSLAPPPHLPPDAPPPLPTPPPLPISQPPSVPPPPTSPPPRLQPALEPSNFQQGESYRHYRWQGTLSKSGVHYCTMYAIREDSAACKYSNALSEPLDWPARLDVTKRTDLRHVKTTFASTRLHRREVCRLLPSATSDHKGFHDFISYLKQRECAGVIKIPAGKSIWARLLFILPCSIDICSLLDISPHPADCLIALVLPRETNPEGA